MLDRGNALCILRVALVSGLPDLEAIQKGRTRIVLALCIACCVLAQPPSPPPPSAAVTLLPLSPLSPIVTSPLLSPFGFSPIVFSPFGGVSPIVRPAPGG